MTLDLVIIFKKKNRFYKSKKKNVTDEDLNVGTAL